MSEPFLGQIITVPYNFAPRNWAFCNGQLLPISQQTALFSLLGTFYGGNGTSNFALPDLQGRVPVHVGGSSGNGPGLNAYDLGESGGEESHTLNAAEIPSHTHTVSPQASHDERTTHLPGDAYPTTGGIYASTHDSVAPMGPQSTSETGGSQPHDNLQPYLVLNYVIAMAGIFPPRS
jgi:microcystin-dependent protein